MNVVVTVVLAFSPATIETGIASQYSPGVMEQVIANRQAGLAVPLPAELPPVDGFIAVLDCADFGEVWFVRPEGGDWGVYLVADCSGHAETTEWMTTNNILLEFDYPTVERLGVVGRGIPVEVVRP
jgi:hypothetical protein